MVTLLARDVELLHLINTHNSGVTRYNKLNPSTGQLIKSLHVCWQFWSLFNSLVLWSLIAHHRPTHYFDAEVRWVTLFTPFNAAILVWGRRTLIPNYVCAGVKLHCRVTQHSNAIQREETEREGSSVHTQSTQNVHKGCSRKATENVSERVDPIFTHQPTGDTT